VVAFNAHTGEGLEDMSAKTSGVRLTGGVKKGESKSSENFEILSENRSMFATSPSAPTVDPPAITDGAPAISGSRYLIQALIIANPLLIVVFAKKKSPLQYISTDME
jgi:hypothetical protein